MILLNIEAHPNAVVAVIVVVVAAAVGSKWQNELNTQKLHSIIKIVEQKAPKKFGFQCKL